MPRFSLIPCLLLASTLMGATVSAQTPLPSATERAQVETFLRNWQKSNLIEQTEIDKLKRLGKSALPLLAGFLEDPELAFFAESAMHQIDPDGATPYLLKELPKRDRNVQREAYRIANRRIQEYDWYVRQGRPTPDPNAAPPRYYTANTKPVFYRRELHDAAVRSLQSSINADAMQEALLTLGLTGSRRDIALLKKWDVPDEGDFWKRNLQTASRAASARLGDRATLDLLARELEKPVTRKPAEPYGRDNGALVPPAPGAIVVPREEGERLRNVMFAAGFSMNRRFVPLLIRHLDDPPGQFHGDYGDPSPALEAKQALSQIVQGKEYDTNTDWKAWWQIHQREYTR